MLDRALRRRIQGPIEHDRRRLAGIGLELDRPSGDRPAQSDNLGWSEPGGSAGPR